MNHKPDCKATDDAYDPDCEACRDERHAEDYADLTTTK